MDAETKALAERAAHAGQCNIAGCDQCYETVDGRRRGRLPNDASYKLGAAVVEQNAKIAELEKINAALWSTVEAVGESREKLIGVCNMVPREMSIADTAKCFHVLYAAIATFVKETYPGT